MSARPFTGVTTSAGRNPATIGAAPLSLYQIPEGKYTYTIYGLIKEHRYGDVVRILAPELETRPNARPTLSLLAHCYYQLQEYQPAAECYEKLVRLFPDVDAYKLYYAQSLFKAGQYDTAMKASLNIENPEYNEQVVKLQAAIKYETNDVAGCRLLVEQASRDDPDTLMNQGCLLFKEGRIEEAFEKYTEAQKLMGYSSELTYYIALCHYLQKRYVPSLKSLSEIIERAVRDHPELNIGMGPDHSDDVNHDTQVLHESFVLEAFNLKAAIEYQLKNYDAAQEALQDMPPRRESDLDPVSLHNMALIHVDTDSVGAFEKLNYLLEVNPCPPETLRNLLLLYIKYQYYDYAADLMAEFQQDAYELLDPFTYEFIDAVLAQQHSPEEASRRLEEMSNKVVDSLRKLTKRVQESRMNRDDDTVHEAVLEYDDLIEQYIPLLMAQAKIFWDKNDYATVEKIFRKSVEFCNENDTWKLNVGHVLFMQESKFKEAISFYEPFVRKSLDDLLKLPAIVVANLCVSYIMSSQNEEAEEIMRRIEKEEERAAYEDPNRRTYHLCIVNMVIGTLYCAKGNFEFGISRIMKSLEEYDRKLSTDTWFYAKRCFVALFEALAKHMITIKDSVYMDILKFLDACELHGKHVQAHVPGFDLHQSDWSVKKPTSLDENKFKNTVAYEARRLKRMYLSLFNDA